MSRGGVTHHFPTRQRLLSEAIDYAREHGAPARVVIPSMYGYKGVKWLNHIEFVAVQQLGYWEKAGYDQNGWVGRSNDKFDTS